MGAGRAGIIIVAVIFISLFAPYPEGGCGYADPSDRLREIERAMTVDGEYAESADELEGLLAEHPDDARVLMDLGIAYYGLADYERAYGQFRAAEAAGPEENYAGLVSYALSNIDENRSVLLSAAETSEKDKEAAAALHLMMVEKLLGEKYYYPAIVAPHLIWLKKNVPEFEGLHAFSAEVYYSSMYYGKAAEDFRKAIEEAPDDARLHRMLADTLVAMGDLDAAQERYDRAIDLYREEGSDRSREEVKRLMRIRGALPKRYEDITDLIRRGRYGEAEVVCRKRISLNPGDSAALTQLGNIYWLQGKRRSAIKMFRRAVKVAPDYPGAHLFLGKAYIFERKPEKAFGEFDIFIEKMELLPEKDDGTLDYYIDALHYIANEYINEEKYDDAMGLYGKILELDPEELGAHIQKGLIYYKYKHNRPRAYTAFNKVIELAPDSGMADVARISIDIMRRSPDPRFEDTPWVDPHLAEIRKMVSEQIQLGTPPSVSRKKERGVGEKVVPEGAE